MSKLMLALGSFTMGAMLGIMASGRASILAQKSQPRSFVEEGMVPTVPPLRHNVLIGAHVGSGFITPLDGLECENCTFDNAAIEYGGGAFHLTNTTFSGTVNVQLTGAAANTFAFLKYLNGISGPAPLSGVPSPTPNPKLPPKPLPSKPPPNKPLRHSVTVTGTVKDSVGSVFGQK
jgi:hypothetical protein